MPELYSSCPAIPYADRESVQQACISFLKPLQHFTSPNGARIRLGETSTHYDDIAAQLEGFARPLWGLASLLAGGGSYELAQQWVDGLVAGTDPENLEYWGEVRDTDQRMVEMAPIGFWICLAGPGENGFWERLKEEERKRIVAWLNTVNIKIMPDTNWLWFRVFANLALRSVGEPYSADKLKADLDHLDTFYVGSGWSADGPAKSQLDYYSGPFAIQTSQLIYSKLASSFDPERAAKFRERATLWAGDFVHYFDPQGRAIPFGRSTTYRFAMASFWGVLAFADLELPAPLTWGVVKGLLLRNLRWWSTQPIFTPFGTLSIGYSYPNQFFTENYNSPGSPYWAMKAFICLAASSSHPFWTTEEAPYPQDKLPQIHAVEKARQIVSHLGGHTFLLSSGQYCCYALKATQAKYGKFSYSSAFAFSVPTGAYTLPEYALDSTLGISLDEGETWLTRRLAPNARIEVREDGTPVLISDWLPVKGISVATTLIPPSRSAPNWYVREHVLVSDRDEEVLVAEGSWAICGQCTPSERHLPLYDENTGEGYSEGDGEAWAVSRAGAVGLKDLGNEKRRGEVLRLDANANLVEARTVLPMLRTKVEKGEKSWRVGVFGVPESVEGWKSNWKERWEESNKL